MLRHGTAVQRPWFVISCETWGSQKGVLLRKLRTGGTLGYFVEQNLWKRKAHSWRIPWHFCPKVIEVDAIQPHILENASVLVSKLPNATGLWRVRS